MALNQQARFNRDAAKEGTGSVFETLLKKLTTEKKTNEQSWRITSWAGRHFAELTWMSFALVTFFFVVNGLAQIRRLKMESG